MPLGRNATNQVHSAVRNINGLDLHPGLLLQHGLSEWPNPQNGQADTKALLIARIANTRPPGYYTAALHRWRQLTSAPQRFASFECAIEGRLYIGVTRDNPLEAGVTTSHTYGMPILPGSSLKGLARAAARDLVQAGTLDQDSFDWMFGLGGDEGEVGGVVFHDAWWCGDGQPFVAEIVTPHQVSYYGTQGSEPPSDTESPIPAPQIAVAGRFYFAVEGADGWPQAAAIILRAALEERGIGAKRTSGYGLMRESPPAANRTRRS